jgi:hypothetical protein
MGFNSGELSSLAKCNASQCITDLEQAGGLLFLPETPRFLIKKGDEPRALKSLVFLRRLSPDDPDIAAELAALKSNWEYEQSLGSASYIECFKGTMGKRTITGIVLQSLQQLVGINFIIYYGTSYFAENVDGLPDSFILQVIVNCVNVVMTLPGLWAIDHFGRRPVLLTGALGMGVSQYIVSACGAATPITNFTSQCAQFAFICIYVSFFGKVNPITIQRTFANAHKSIHIWPLRLGCHGRDLLASDACERSFHDHCGELVLQLATIVHYAIPHWSAQPNPVQRVLDLG